MKVDVGMNITKLQSYIDYYLKLTSRESVSDIDKLRKEFFNLFMEEDKYRKDSFLCDYDEDEEIDLYDDEQDKTSEETENIEVSKVDWLALESEENKQDNEIDKNEYYEHGVYIEDLEVAVPEESEPEEDYALNQSSKWSYEEHDSSETTDHGVYLEDLQFEEQERVEEQPEDEDYFSDPEENMKLDEVHGVYIEDLSVDPEINNENLEQTECIEHVEHGVFLEDLIINEDSDEAESIELGKDTWNLKEDVEEDELEEEPEIMEEAEDVIEVEGSEDDFLDWEYEDEEDELENVNPIENSQEEKIEIVKEENSKNNEKEQKNESLKIEEPKSIEVEKEDVPTDLRMYVKLHPNCDVNTVLKYYSKKELDKQLKLGRIFKRNKKLFI